VLACAGAVVLVASASAAFPTVTTGPALMLSASGATLTGTVDPKGGETVWSFEFGTTAAYGTTTTVAPVGNGNANVPVSVAIGGLSPATTYHYRLVATGASGTKDGADHTFTTLAIPLTFSITSSPNPVTFGDTLLVEGTLSGTGSAGHAVVLQANPFPYTAGFATIGNPELTNANGTFEFAFPGLVQTAQLRVMTTDASPTVSAVITQEVAVKITLGAAKTTRKHYVRLYGTVTPAEPGAQVGFERYVGGKRPYVTVAGTVVHTASGSMTPTDSTFSQTVLVPKTGAYRALVLFNTGAQAPANSNSILIH
jgi:hypothetical protein